jgi:hypothetical protein
VVVLESDTDGDPVAGIAGGIGVGEQVDQNLTDAVGV